MPKLNLISKKPKIKKIGIRSHNPLLWGSVQNRDTYDIVEFGKVTHLHHKPSKLLSSHLYLNGVDGIDSALVRLNFYVIIVTSDYNMFEILKPIFTKK